MSSKIAHYLQQHIQGEVTASPETRSWFATDASIFTVPPAVIVYPANEADVRKVARFSWQLAERGQIIPITCRGAGTDQSGAAIGSGIILAFPAHMNKILTLDSKKGTLTVEPGLKYLSLQQTLNTHGLFMPPYPASINYSTIGGAVGNNASGEKSVKYGATKDYVEGLKVVLANGEVIETKRISKRELNRKMGLTSFEGEIYRQIDALIMDNAAILKSYHRDVTKNSAGYDLVNVKHSDGSFDLTPLIIGSQGTLGIVTEIRMRAEPYNPQNSLFAVFFDDFQRASDAVQKLRKLQPSALEIVDENLLKFLDQHNPAQLLGIIEKPFPKAVLLVEFDDIKVRLQKRKVKKAIKIVEKLAYDYRVERTDADAKDRLWKIRRNATAVIWQSIGNQKALPIIEDGVVPPEKLALFMQEAHKLYAKYGLQAAIWGHAGDGNLHMQPFLDLSQVADRQKVFKIMDDFYEMVIALGGSTSGEHGDGRVRGPYLKHLVGPELYSVFEKVKAVFDPYTTLNPGVKIAVTQESVKPLLRQEYGMPHLNEHMPQF